ncbi:carbohydrate kinase family protein [Streptomyces albipurpureus]|uniref:Carbohydrate kinase family protein n=1 Tax=Streptomyces albipurpureus TaxID=2897419 RepID=A0ABT0UFI5_9ACTN|nr:carbohydrate kinase family protein [Streptomyces sp. CWNU-1]MCM2386754.1 carbohydrate kinase family protein [Streptomyces sp. CWNU-1]
MATVVRVGSLPVPLADVHGVNPIHEWPGHSGGNVALGCRALGMNVAFLDFVGDDWAGRQVHERLINGGVAFDPLLSPTGTRRAVSLVDPSGRRMSFHDGRDPDELRMPRAFYLPYLQRARHIHLSAVNFARYLFDDIAELGVPVSTDLQDWDGVDERQREFALRSDLVFLSSAGAGERIASVMREILRGGRAQAVIATAGAGGSYLLTRDGSSTPRPIPASIPPAPVVDSSGAGDAYVCGFLYGRLCGQDLEESARLGALAGAHACTGEGSSALIGRDQLLAARI